MKIKIKKLESEIVSLKYKYLGTGVGQGRQGEISSGFANKSTLKGFQSKLSNSNNHNRAGSAYKTKTIDDNNETYERMIDRFKEEIINYENRIETLENERNSYKSTCEKLEKLQKELFAKVKSSNKEIGEIKSIYDVIKKNLEEEKKLSLKDYEVQIKKISTENANLKKKIKELIEISDKLKEDSGKEKEKLENEKEILKKVISGKTHEIGILETELIRFNESINKVDSKDILKISKHEEEIKELKKANAEIRLKESHLLKVIQTNEFQIQQLTYGIEAKSNELVEKDNEIDMLTLKLKEFESILLNKLNFN